MFKEGVSSTRLIDYAKESKPALKRISRFAKKYVRDISGKNLREAKKNIGDLYMPHDIGIMDFLRGLRKISIGNNKSYKRIKINPRNYEGLSKVIKDRNIARGATALPVLGVGGVALLNKEKAANVISDIMKARKETNINPTEKQIKAENYKKGTFKWNGLVIKLENPKGSTRSGTSPDGKTWSTTMKHDYGYVGATKSNSDGDAVDIFMGKHPESQVVYIVDQVNKDGSFDEHKCILGALTEDEARKTYLDNYEKGWTCGKITAMTIPHFKEWVMKGNTGKPVSGMKLFKVAQSINMLTNIVASGRHTDNEGDGNMRCPIMLKSASGWDRIIANPEIDKAFNGAINGSRKIDMKKFRQLNLRGIDKELAEGKEYHNSLKSRFLAGGRDTKREVFDESLALGVAGGFAGSIATPILSLPYHILRKIKKKPSLFGASIAAGGLLGAITGATARGIHGRRKIQDPGEYKPDEEMTYSREEMLKPYVKGKRHYMNDIYGIADGGDINFDMVKAGDKK